VVGTSSATVNPAAPGSVIGTGAFFFVHNDFQHKESRKVIQQYRTIFAEDLNIKGLSRGFPAKISSRCVLGILSCATMLQH
jgi:hypothetical protein